MAHFLTDREAEVLREMVRDWERDNASRPPRQVPYVQLPSTPEVNVVKLLADAPGLGAVVDTGTGTGTVDQVYEVECQVYRLRNDLGTFTLEEVFGLTRIAYNLSEAALPAGTLALVKKDKYGSWYIEPLATDVGTGTSDSSCDPCTPVPATCGIGSGWAIGLRSTKCLLATIVSTSGACACHDSTDTGTGNYLPDVYLTHDDANPGQWVSADAVTICGTAYLIRFYRTGGSGGLPSCTLTEDVGSGGLTYSSTMVCLGSGFATFAFGTDPPCSGDEPFDCTANELLISLSCVECPGIQPPCLQQEVPLTLYLYTDPLGARPQPEELFNAAVDEWDNVCLLDFSCTDGAGSYVLACAPGVTSHIDLSDGSFGVIGIIISYTPFIASYEPHVIGRGLSSVPNGVVQSFTGLMPSQGSGPTSTALGTASGTAVTDITIVAVTVNAGEYLLVQFAIYDGSASTAVFFDGNGMQLVHRRQETGGAVTIAVETWILLVSATTTGDVLAVLDIGTGTLLATATAIGNVRDDTGLYLREHVERTLSGSGVASSAFDTGTTFRTGWPDEVVFASFAFVCPTGSFALGTWGNSFSTDQDVSIVVGGDTVGLTTGYKNINACQTLQATKSGMPSSDWAGIITSIL